MVEITDGVQKRHYPIFQQKAGTYGKYSEYLTRHGCACCSLTTVLAAFCEEYAGLRPDQEIQTVEKDIFPEEIWAKNYGKPMARQMPVSLYGISVILQKKGIPCHYVRNFQDDEAEEQIREHLYQGLPVVIETSRIRRSGKGLGRFFDKTYAGSYHTMVLLGIDEDGKAVFTDSATRSWAGEQQRLKREELSKLIPYMFPCKNEEDRHLYFSKRRDTGGYILLQSR